jgi:hypothetical protein
MWKMVKPFCDTLNIGGAHVGTIIQGSAEIFGKEETDWQEKRKLREIMVEKIEAELAIKFKSSGADKQEKLKMIKELFGTASWTEISERVDMATLERGYQTLTTTARFFSPIQAVQKIYAQKVVTPDDFEAACIASGLPPEQTETDAISGLVLSGDYKGAVKMLIAAMTEVKE